MKLGVGRLRLVCWGPYAQPPLRLRAPCSAFALFPDCTAGCRGTLIVGMRGPPARQGYARLQALPSSVHSGTCALRLDISRHTCTRTLPLGQGQAPYRLPSRVGGRREQTARREPVDKNVFNLTSFSFGLLRCPYARQFRASISPCSPIPTTNTSCTRLRPLTRSSYMRGFLVAPESRSQRGCAGFRVLFLIGVPCGGPGRELALSP